MSTEINPVRYDRIRGKNPREILMLRGSGCRWRRCTFCDYHLDFSRDSQANYQLNHREIAKVTGIYHRLEVINSGSFNELDDDTIREIRNVCVEKEISHLHFEMHWMHRAEISRLRLYFLEYNIRVHVKMGVETFDAHFRDDVLKKGMEHVSPEEIVPYADEVCLLFGLTGQTEESMRTDVETALKLFDRVCINIMVKNTTRVLPDRQVIELFSQALYPDYIDNSRVDILMTNTDFGVGENLGPSSS